MLQLAGKSERDGKGRRKDASKVDAIRQTRSISTLLASRIPERDVISVWLKDAGFKEPGAHLVSARLLFMHPSDCNSLRVAFTQRTRTSLGGQHARLDVRWHAERVEERETRDALQMQCAPTGKAGKGCQL